MSITRHFSRAMLSRYSHVRMDAKRHALDEIPPGSGGREAQSSQPKSDRGAPPIARSLAEVRSNYESLGRRAFQSSLGSASTRSVSGACGESSGMVVAL
jgi:hypothetical protein